MAIEYNEKVLDHFFNPRNVGVIEDADGIGRLGDASCGDVFVMYIKVRRGRIVDIKHQVQGCGAAIATCSALSEIAIGKTVQEAWRPPLLRYRSLTTTSPRNWAGCPWRNCTAPTWLQPCCIEPSLITPRTRRETCATGRGCISS